ncbi:MAG: GTPase ObgE [Minisyncoccota bacterium]
MFIDEVTLALRAGNGGDGVVRWRHEKGKANAGPSGGDGGRGGSVYAEAVRAIDVLAQYRKHKDFFAERGHDGARDSLHGKNGKDLVITLPVGSVLTNRATRRTITLLTAGERVLLLSGGDGGFGNEHFKSSTNRSPKRATKGHPGEAAEFYIELELIADAGLIGFPNAGKSSLLNALSKARAKVGAYPFTTLEPNLGSFHGYIVADIPGLIEGASEGKGLGHKFLRHVKRTHLLVHLISLEEREIADRYHAMRRELGAYSPELLKKPELLVLTKTDVVDEATLKQRIAQAKKLNPKVSTVTLYDDASIGAFTKEFSRSLAENSSSMSEGSLPERV